jgi:hypothetical protein
LEGESLIGSLAIAFALSMTQIQGATQAPAEQAPARIVPLDEASKDESFVVFRNELIDAIDQRNLKGVLGAVSADVRVTLTGRKGIPALRQLWHLDSSPTSFLRELRAVLILGGRFEQPCSFTAPYVWTEFPASLFPLDYLVVVRDKTVMYAAADAKSKQVAVLSEGEIVQIDGGTTEWAGIERSAGLRGYVSLSAVRRPASFRAFFTKIMSEWKLVGFFDGYG